MLIATSRADIPRIIIITVIRQFLSLHNLVVISFSWYLFGYAEALFCSSFSTSVAAVLVTTQGLSASVFFSLVFHISALLSLANFFSLHPARTISLFGNVRAEWHTSPHA
jgi:hypothetical protein